MFIFERDRVQVGEGQRARGTHRFRSKLQALSCQHRAWRGARIHEPWDHDLSWRWTLNQLRHPGAPRSYFQRVPSRSLPTTPENTQASTGKRDVCFQNYTKLKRLKIHNSKGNSKAGLKTQSQNKQGKMKLKGELDIHLKGKEVTVLFRRTRRTMT